MIVEAFASPGDIPEPIISNGALIVIAVIGAFQAITIALISRNNSKTRRIDSDVQQVKDQIVNHHPKSPNFRDENDGRHAETKRWIKDLSDKMDNVTRLTEMLYDGYVSNRRRIQSIEDTQETRRSKREREQRSDSDLR